MTLSEWLNPDTGPRKAVCTQCRSRVPLASGHTICEWCLISNIPPVPTTYPISRRYLCIRCSQYYPEDLVTNLQHKLFILDGFSVREQWHDVIDVTTLGAAEGAARPNDTVGKKEGTDDGR
jgi:DNA-directed RNA polymerase subunit RPC12/RpoP